MFVDNYGEEFIDDILINGRGVDVDPLTGQTANSTAATPRAEFYVERGFRHRFRVVHAGFLFCPLELSIDYHDLLIIAVDGNPVVPLHVKSIILAAGYYIYYTFWLFLLFLDV